jgi:hypothetical protein
MSDRTPYIPPSLLEDDPQVEDLRAEVERLRGALREGWDIVADYAPGFTVWLEQTSPLVSGGYPTSHPTPVPLEVVEALEAASTRLRFFGQHGGVTTETRVPSGVVQVSEGPCPGRRGGECTCGHEATRNKVRAALTLLKQGGQ